VIRDGKVAWAKGYGVLQAGKPDKVNTETMFSVGSVSKVAAASVSLRLVDAGKIELDRNVNQYLTRWKVPENELTAVSPVTLRGLLSHTAGTSVKGFKDYQPNEPIPTLLDTLEGRAPAKNVPVRVELLPGTKHSYSGGGVTVEQLLIEEVSGVAFKQAASKYLFEPLGMKRSSFESPLPASFGNIAKAHGKEGEPRALPRGYETLPETAASGLWSTPSDYAKLIIALIDSYRGKAGSFLSPALAHQMMSEVGVARHGLGPVLKGSGAERVFFHDGSNDSYKAHMQGHLGTGNGVVIFTNGANGSSLYWEALRSVAAAEGWPEDLSSYRQAQPFPLPTAELQQFAGIYQLQSGASSYRHRGREKLLQVSYQNGQLSFDDRELVPIDANHFVFPDFERGTIEFVRGYDGRIETLIVQYSDGGGWGGTQEFKKVR
ncbi:serine hydrolase domain-containing protein, partial [Steroidobacter sp.]|uniref:serine hydrolase domain-containing protein n=1 Tax=Steroidobacter sp. TaxID=1978227 RepID=UPI001A468533